MDVATADRVRPDVALSPGSTEVLERLGWSEWDNPERSKDLGWSFRNTAGNIGLTLLLGEYFGDRERPWMHAALESLDPKTGELDQGYRMRVLLYDDSQDLEDLLLKTAHYIGSVMTMRFDRTD